MNEDHVVIAALSSKESVTIPSIMASGKPRTMVAQAGEIQEKRGQQGSMGAVDTIDKEWEYLGLNAVQWIGTGYAAAILGGLAYLYWPEGEKERRAEQIPVCP